jgi:ABC-type sugar transport system permease subunit
MSKLPRIIAIVLFVAGVVMIVAGSVTYYIVHRELADEHIVVSDDADNFAGKSVEGPFTAYSQAMVIKEHASEIADGQTYAQLAQDDPRRESVMDASFLRASLFTSVVAFGVAVLVIGLGLLFILVGLAIWALDRRRQQPAEPAVAAEPAPLEPAPAT